MKRRFSEERIIGLIKEHGSGVETGDIMGHPALTLIDKPLNRDLFRFYPHC